MAREYRADGQQPVRGGFQLREGLQPLQKIAMPKDAIKGMQPLKTQAPPPPPPTFNGVIPVAKPKK